MRLAPDAQKVAYSKGDPNSDIWVQELKRDVPMRLTFDTSVDKGAPVWSPDGSEILFDIALGGKTPAGIAGSPGPQIYKKYFDGDARGALDRLAVHFSGNPVRRFSLRSNLCFGYEHSIIALVFDKQSPKRYLFPTTFGLHPQVVPAQDPLRRKYDEQP
jgi:hypothetical protein